jgi:hypothetical protein
VDDVLVSGHAPRVQWRIQALFRARPIAIGVAAGLGAALVMALRSAVLPNPLFTRMTPARPPDYVFLPLSALLLGAIGCPICNKIVVFILGVSGALTYWAPVQPFLGAAAVALLAWTLHLRIRPMLSREEASP